MDCNETTLEAQTQLNASVYHLVNTANMCVSCTLNTLLSVPLLVAMVRPPSLLRHTRFLLLTHLLLCDNLQVDLLLSTALAVDRFVAVKWPLRYECLMCPKVKRAMVAVIWTSSAVLCAVALAMGLDAIQLDFLIPRCRPLVLSLCLSRTSAVVLFCTVVSAVVVPFCFLTILGCFCLLCWDMRAGLLSSKRACVTLSLQVAQTVLFSVPVVIDSYLIPGYLHNSDFLDLAATITYNLGVLLIPLVYGYRSRELQERIRQVARIHKVDSQSQF